MATKTKTKPKVLTPAELQDAIRATLEYWFPHCKHVAVAFIPAPGAPPMELWVSGSVFDVAGISDEWYTGNGVAASWQGASRWLPPDAD
jgi:hypothetical protein